MKRNKKGFTLIELLAVIVILAVIALIAVPVVMNIINKTNKSAFKDTAYGILSAGELYFAEQQLNVSGMSGEKTFDLSTDVNTEDGLQIKGEVPTGTLKINEKGETALAITNGRYCITKKYTDKDVTVTEDVANCKIPEEPKTLEEVTRDLSMVEGSNGENGKASCVTDETQCAAGTALAIQVNSTEIYKFYVLNDDGKKVTLIMAEDLGEPVAWSLETYCETYENEDGVEEEYCDYVNTYGPITALQALKTRTQNWTNIAEYSYELHYGRVHYPIFDLEGEREMEFFEGKYSGEYVQNVRARMPKYSDLSDFWEEFVYDEETGDTDQYLPSWLIEGVENNGEDGYWLSDATGSEDYYFADAVEPHQIKDDAAGTWAYETVNEYGLRPVIIVNK